jgi:hypothetical protein
VADCPPVLLLVCDRPDLTRKVVDRVRAARPQAVYIAADGARTDGSEGEEALGAALDAGWDCEVHTLARDRNLGCKEAVASGLAWFFDRVDEGIVLEDDCVPDPSFFRFCAELLERYREDELVMGVGGNSFRRRSKPPASYTFSIYNQTWGWATWRRAWRHYDGALGRWPELRETGWLERLLGDRAAVRFWREVFDRDFRSEIDTWDFSWTFACWVQNGLTAHPSVNLVANIGFDERATHTRNPSSRLANVETRSIGFPLLHPPDVLRDHEEDRFTAEHVHRVRLRTSRLRRAGYRLLRRDS